MQENTKCLPFITAACELYDFFQKEKPYCGYNKYGLFDVKLLAQTHGLKYSEDIPVLSGEYYDKIGAPTLSDNYFTVYNPKIEFKLYYLYSQANKNAGKIGVAYKALERCEECLAKLDKVDLSSLKKTDNHVLSHYETIYRLLKENFIQRRAADESHSFDLKSAVDEFFLLLLGKITLSFYLSEYGTTFHYLEILFKQLVLLHKFDFGNIAFNKIQLLARESLNILIEIVVKYAQLTVEKEVVTLGIQKIEIAHQVNLNY